ncbi:hypothetical protein BCS84_15725 [Vibrio cyclitrophicus]|uniref:hypothetical protein n=1 Tax=Vibrio cyclitrophicus TaxID=47951 RepID=UPI00036AC54C|nr:hypothetical protein [Vibrio cyclitrophicus]OED86101.1 hypothetical protein OAQ_10480 [Vibrio cyclitrophicus ZF30]OEE16306.1 hypothetical protein OC1_11590 [Vibrio cyclitrophicus ZF207]PMJ28442.1 hypothetical protein BCU25_19935 [Vibrio cyclitrophicus]PMP52172.1 hypothetical protein BCS84_21570 [Vibrio cyclitrophicus]
MTSFEDEVFDGSGVLSILDLLILIGARKFRELSISVIIVLSTLPFSLSAHSENGAEHGHFYLAAKLGIAQVKPELDYNAWTLKDNQVATIGASQGYAFDINHSIELTYRRLNKVTLRAQYPQHRYRLPTLWYQLQLHSYGIHLSNHFCLLDSVGLISHQQVRRLK